MQHLKMRQQWKQRSYFYLSAACISNLYMWLMSNTAQLMFDHITLSEQRGSRILPVNCQSAGTLVVFDESQL